MTGKEELSREVDRLTLELDKARAKILKTHSADCWKMEGHHSCAIVHINDLQKKLDTANRSRSLFAQLNTELMKEIRGSE